MVALNVWSFHGHSIIETTEGSHDSPTLVSVQYFLQVASALLVSFAEGSLDGVSVTSIASLKFGFFGLAGDTCALDRLDCLVLLLSHRFGRFWLALLAKLLLGGSRLRQSLTTAFLEVPKT